MLGRVSLNPARHIDLVGTIFLPLVMLFASGGRLMFRMGEAVPVNFTPCGVPSGTCSGWLLPARRHNLVMALGGAAALKNKALSGLRGTISWCRCRLPVIE